MRDVVTDFYCDVLGRLISSGDISAGDRVLVVCGGPLDEAVMKSLGFRNFEITNLDGNDDHRQDAECLTYDDETFDLAIVHAGLHHCYSPHRALLEMYRVARKGVIAFESRDSILMRVAIRLGLTLDYETDSVSNGKGGVANTGIPNFVYRWTEREVIKTIASFDPAHEPAVQFFYDLRFPIQRLSSSGATIMRAFALAIEPFSRVIARLAPKQCNEFAFIVTKRSRCHPWIK